jgi:hypothetical protein
MSRTVANTITLAKNSVGASASNRRRTYVCRLQLFIGEYGAEMLGQAVAQGQGRTDRP